MYIWKSTDLANDLRNNNVTEKEKLKYILFWVLATAIASDPFLYTDYEYVLNDAVMSLVMLVIAASGTIYCYKINKGGDNKDFINRYICLSIPVGVRVLSVLIILFSSIIIIDLSFELNYLGGEKETYTTSIYEIVILAIFMLWAYYYLGKFIKMASTKVG